MPFIYSIHESLALGDTGVLILGLAALLRLIQCFIGGYLTLPYSRVSPPRRLSSNLQRPWLERWTTAWKIRIQRNFAKVAFDLDRADGLWLWALLFVFSASAISFNLPAVYKPIVSHLLGFESRFDSLPEMGFKTPAKITGREAYAAAVLAIQIASKIGNFLRFCRSDS